MLSRKVHIPIYDQDIEVFYGSVEQYRNYISQKHNHLIQANSYTEGSTTELVVPGYRNLYVWFNSSHVKKEDTQKIVKIISHELVHVTDKVLHYADIKDDRKNNEARAYLTGFLAEQIYVELLSLIDNF